MTETADQAAARSQVLQALGIAGDVCETCELATKPRMSRSAT